MQPLMAALSAAHSADIGLQLRLHVGSLKEGKRKYNFCN